MPGNFEVRRIENGRVLVILHPACAIRKEAILALLAEFGIDEAMVDFLLPGDAANCNGIDNVPVVIPIDQGNCNTPELDTAGRQCAQAGGRVIILIGETFPYENLHPVADKYGTQCGWSADQLEACVASSALPPPRTSDGTFSTRPKAEQVKC